MEDKKTIKKVWKPATLLNVSGLDTTNYVYRWIRKEQENIDKKKEEGWEIVKSVTKSGNEKTDPATLADGKQLDSTIQKRGLILARMPKDLAESRKEYFSRLTDERLEGIKTQLNQQTGGLAYGEIRERKG